MAGSSSSRLTSSNRSFLRSYSKKPPKRADALPKVFELALELIKFHRDPDPSKKGRAFYQLRHCLPELPPGAATIGSENRHHENPTRPAVPAAAEQRRRPSRPRGKRGVLYPGGLHAGRAAGPGAL